MQDLNAARVFATVVEAQSFTTAAERLDMPKSTVSRRVSELEEQLGTQLLYRTTRKLSLTEEGAVYYRRVAEGLARFEEAERALGSAHDTPRGTLRMTAPIDLGGRFAGQLIVAFTRLYPEVKVAMELTQRRVDLVGEGFDLALRAGPAMRDSTLVMRKLAESPIAMFASPDYLARAGEPRCLQDLSDHECVMFGSNAHSVWKFVGPEGEREVAVSGRIVCNDFGFCATAAIAGAGITAMPRPAAMIEVAAGRLSPVLPQYESQPGAIYAVYPSNRHLTPRVRAFVDFVTEHAEQLFAGREL